MMGNNLNEANRWLEQARRDLEVARWDAQGSFWAATCFVCQQAAEKALKAFLYACGEREVHGHELLTLCAACERYDADFQSVQRASRVLSRYYIATRYPDSVAAGPPAEHFDEQDAQEALRYAQEVLALVEGKIQALMTPPPPPTTQSEGQEEDSPAAEEDLQHE